MRIGSPRFTRSRLTSGIDSTTASTSPLRSTTTSVFCLGTSALVFRSSPSALPPLGPVLQRNGLLRRCTRSYAVRNSSRTVAHVRARRRGAMGNLLVRPRRSLVAGYPDLSHRWHSHVGVSATFFPPLECRADHRAGAIRGWTALRVRDQQPRRAAHLRRRVYHHSRRLVPRAAQGALQEVPRHLQPHRR